jgi:hypothetical protein
MRRDQQREERPDERQRADDEAVLVWRHSPKLRAMLRRIASRA